MEVFVPLLTRCFAVAHASADALYRQNIPLVAKFAITNMDAALVFILVGKLR